MKTYSKPTTTVHKLVSEQILSASKNSGTKSGNAVQNEYDSADISYSRHTSLWDSEEE